jgi:hypothetical protein
MKYLFFSLALLCGVALTKAHAQFGLQAGPVGIFGEAFETADGRDKPGGALGYTFGLTYNFGLGDKFVLQPGLNFLNKQ